MGKISSRLSASFRSARRSNDPLRRQAKQDFAKVGVLKDIRTLVEEGSDPLHAAYTAVQNFMSFFSESVSVLDELQPYYRIVCRAEDDYMPSYPPMSPLTVSYFTTWAFFDVRFGPDKETIGTCLLSLAKLLEMDPGMAETIRLFQDTRMGIYEHCGWQGGRWLLRELVTGDEFRCYVPTGYQGKQGELWYVRLCPPVDESFDYHVAFTTPYILGDASPADWTAYLKKSILRSKCPDPRNALHEFLKYGKKPNHWNEFVFLAYHHYQHDAIFLAGLPDVKGSLPHAN